MNESRLMYCTCLGVTIKMMWSITATGNVSLVPMVLMGATSFDPFCLFGAWCKTMRSSDMNHFSMVICQLSQLCVEAIQMTCP